MKGEAWRWAICAAIVVAAHGLTWRALSTPNLADESDAGSPVITLELSPVAAAPAPALDEPQADAQPTEAAAAPPTEPPSPAPQPIETPPDTPPPAPQPAADSLAPPPPPPPPTPPTPNEEAPKETPAVVELPPQPPSPPPSAPSTASTNTAEVAAAPQNVAGSEEEASPAVLSRWRQELIAQIERHKRFPANALGRSGVASVAFTIDRSGHLTAVHLVASSGSAALDEAALDLIRRSQPFPTPPAALRESDLSFAAPVRYLPSASR